MMKKSERMRTRKEITTITIMRVVEESEREEEEGAVDEDCWRNSLSDIFTVVLSVL